MHSESVIEKHVLSCWRFLGDAASRYARSVFSGGERNACIDTVKGLAILGVVVIHFGGTVFFHGATDTAKNWGLVLNQFFTWAVPIFFFFSGALLGSGGISGATSTFYTRKLWRIYLPVIIADIALWRYTNGADYIQSVTIKNFLFKFFYSGIHPIHFFVSVLVQFLVVYPLIIWGVNVLAGKLGRGRTLLCGLIVTLAVQGVLGHLVYKQGIPYVYFCTCFFIFWLPYFYCGLFFEEILNSLSSNARHLVGFSACLLWAGLTAFNIYLVLYHPMTQNIGYHYARPVILCLNFVSVAVCAMILTFRLPLKNTFLAWLGRSTYSIYLWHLLLLWLFVWSQPQIMQIVYNEPDFIIWLSVLWAAVIACCADLAMYIYAALVNGGRSLLRRKQ